MKNKKVCCFILSIILILICLPVTVVAKEGTDNIVRVGTFEGIYNVENEKGERSGYGYEYLQNISGYAGWKYQYVTSTWEKCFDELEKGNIDILGGISYTDERAKKMLFSDMPMGEERYYIYTNGANAELSAVNLSTFDGKNIGVLEDHIPEDVLKAWEKKNDIDMKHINVSTTEEIMDKLKKNELNCFVSTESAIWEDLKISPATYIGESNIYFAINKNRPDIKSKLDDAMRRIKDDNPFYTDELYKHYLSAQSSALISKDEKDWLRNHGTIKIGYLNNDTGISVMDSETGKLTGVITDYVMIAKNSLQGQNLDFELKGYDTRSEQLKALKNGDIDIIFHVSQNPYSAETNGFVLSDKVWEFNMAAITAGNNFNETYENVVAVAKDNFALKAYISYNYPQWKIKEYDDKNAAIKAMKNGDVDCILCNSTEVQDYLRKKSLHSFFLSKSADASFAIRQGESLLLSIMNKTLMSIPTSKFSGAVVSYSNATKKVTILDFLRDNLWIGFIFLIFIVAVISILLVKSVSSGRRAKWLNIELNVQKRQLEDALKEAKLQSEIIGSISKIYSFIYRINLKDGTYEEISPDLKIYKLAGKRGLFSEVKESVINAMVAEEYRDIIFEFMDFSIIQNHLENVDTISIEYRTLQNTWQMAQIIVKNRDENGIVTDVLYTVRQIDKQKQLENEYKQELLFNSRVLSGISSDYTIAFVLNLDTDSYEIAFNKNTNHAKEDDNIKTFREYVKNYEESFVLPEFRDSFRETLSRENIMKRFASEDDYHFSFETTPNSAGLSCFQVHIVKEFDEGGHFAFLGFRSVDDVIRQEREYKQKLQDQLDLITSALPGGVKISNDDSTYSFKYVSEQFATMLGYDSPEDLIDTCGGSISGLAHPDDLNAGIADALEQYSRANQYVTSYRVLCKDGSYKYIEDRGQKVISNDGTVEHWNLILDKNDLMEKTIALESERKANKSKSNFLARMSHDMRTPLNGIIGLIKINIDHFDDVDLVKENYRKMQVAASHLKNLINDVLQMSKIEDGDIPLTHEVINLIELSRDIITIIEQRTEENGINMEINSSKEIYKYPYVYGSPLHIKQIFLNIYSNCIKYNNPGGKIETTACLEADGEGRCTYKWTIKDTGIGMSKEFLKHIFDPFRQEKDDARSVYQGTGLGMSIVKGLLEKMGGTITVDSEEGIGSTFEVCIPFEIAISPEVTHEEEQESDIDLHDLNLLLVEDNELNAEIAKMLLEDAGAKITLARDGKQALELFRKSEEGSFDTVLMDIMMPVMDGYEATEEIRKLKRSDAKTVPIIAMTANAFAEDAKKCIDAGMNAHLAKPLEMKKIKKTIQEQIKLCAR